MQNDAVLYVVATPIGNVDDLTPRALRTLKEVDLVAAEDTRRTGRLLAHWGIKQNLISYHDHGEEKRAEKLLQRMVDQSLAVALVSDAGTPCVSDPGYRLVSMAHARGVAVHPVPGVSALISLVSTAGLPCHRFTFVGFLPGKPAALRREITSWKNASPPAAVIFYESPRRLHRTLEVVAGILPAARLAVGRELTKLHEEIKTGSVEDLLAWAGQHSTLRGEVAVMVWPGEEEGPVAGSGERQLLEDSLSRELAGGSTMRDLLRRYRDCGLSRSELYQLLLDLKSAQAGEGEDE